MNVYNASYFVLYHYIIVNQAIQLSFLKILRDTFIHTNLPLILREKLCRSCGVTIKRVNISTEIFLVLYGKRMFRYQFIVMYHFMVAANLYLYIY